MLTGKGGEMSHYTPRVLARTELAKALKSKPERAARAGIKESELDAIAVAGDDAREADREQNVEVAESRASISDRAERETKILESGDALRNRMPAVIRTLLEGGDEEDARFLSALSFARFRLRHLPAPDPSLADDPRVKKVERVEREDKHSRLAGLASFIATLLTRDAIVAELASRGMDRDFLTALHADADAAARAGQNVQRATEATARESAAVREQGALWKSLRRMIREAVQGDPELEALYARC
jgi:hypothetical protein